VRKQKQENTIMTTAETTVALVKVDTALKSLRSSEFDTPAAVGELIDNSIQAGAKIIRIKLSETQRAAAKGNKKKPTMVVDRIAVADDGAGMDRGVLRESLVLGYSTRYNSRTGMGRFGVGATLAGINQAKRIDIWSRAQESQEFLHSYIDLDEVETGTQQYMPEPAPMPVDDEFRVLLPKGSGTLVVWSKCDRLTEGEDGTIHNVGEVRNELVKWIARTYRWFIDGGSRIEVNGEPVHAFDPLFQMTIPTFPNDPKAETILDENFDWDLPNRPGQTASIRYKVTLLPPEWRTHVGAGGGKLAKDRRIDTNEGLSIMRANREIFYGKLTGRFFPGWEEKDIDRWWGLEISFDPVLDECFRVRNIKKGAEPVDRLRDKLRDLLVPTVKSLRKRIQTERIAQENKDLTTQGIHSRAEDIAAENEQTAPPGQSGTDVSPDERDQKVDEAVTAATSSAGPEAPPPAAVKDRVKQLPFSILDLEWHGKEFIEIEHLGQNTIIKLNKRHPFFTKVYSKVLKATNMVPLEALEAELAGDGAPKAIAPMTEDEVRGMARIVQIGLDLLLVAYAKAESMDRDPDEKYGDLRSHWGLFLYNLIQRLKETV
jgi:hypothetical protein